MSKILLAVPNVCEGRDQGFIDRLTEKLRAVPGVTVLDVSRDSVRNRTVLAYTGAPEALIRGGFVVYEESLSHIDMSRHQGEYPRLGAVDVFPFVPLADSTMEEAVSLAGEFATQISEKYQLPVFLFGEAAKYPARRDLENIRKGEMEGLAEKLKDPRWQPDFGPSVVDPKKGATIIGARHPLISFKVLLNTPEERIAEEISRGVHEGFSGPNYVKAYAGLDNDRNMAQLTIYITNYRATPMYRAIESVRMEARRFGVSITRVEMIGLIPEVAFIESAFYYMNVQGFSFDHLLEQNIQKHLAEKVFID